MENIINEVEKPKRRRKTKEQKAAELRLTQLATEAAEREALKLIKTERNRKIARFVFELIKLGLASLTGYAVS